MKPRDEPRKMRLPRRKHTRAVRATAGQRTLLERQRAVEAYCRSSIDYGHLCDPLEVLRLLYGEDES